MQEIIDQLKKNLKELEEQHAVKEYEDYKKQIHKSFKVGEYVRKGQQIGKVYWVENKAMNCVESDGFMAVDLMTGTRGLACFEKRNEWQLVSAEEKNYYDTAHILNIQLTGEQIEDIKYYLNLSNGRSTPNIVNFLEQIEVPYTL